MTIRAPRSGWSATLSALASQRIERSEEYEIALSGAELRRLYALLRSYNASFGLKMKKLVPEPLSHGTHTASNT